MIENYIKNTIIIWVLNASQVYMDVFTRWHRFFRLVPCLLFCVTINISIYFSNRKYLKPKEESTMGVDSWLFVFSVIDEGALLFLVVYFVSFYDIICSSMLTLLSDKLIESGSEHSQDSNPRRPWPQQWHFIFTCFINNPVPTSTFLQGRDYVIV